MTTGTDVAAHRVVATAGHVDHGKSTLLRALTGMEPDRLEEERRRGLSIELGFVWMTLPAADSTDASGPTGASGPTVAFVDVPGHERFIGTMLAGVGAVAGALFVVAADDGWSAQSEEHLEILDLLGVRGVAVAVTKAALAGPERTAAVIAAVRDRLVGTSLEATPAVATDAVTGQGMAALRDLLAQRLSATSSALPAGRPRLWVDRVFTMAGAGTVVTGTLQGARLQVGDPVMVLPEGREGRIRGLQSLGHEVAAATPGTRVAVNLAGIDRRAVGRGDALVGGDGWRTVREVDVVARALPGRRLEAKGAWHVHVGSAHTTTMVRPLTGAVEPGAAGAVRLSLDRPLPLLTGDRLVLREAGRRVTAGGGLVVDTAPPSLPAQRTARTARATALTDLATGADGPPDRATWLEGLLRAAGVPRRRDQVLAGLDWPPGEPLPAEVLAAGPLLVHQAVARPWLASIHATVTAGPSDRETLVRAAVGAGAPAAAAPALIDALADAGQMVRTPGGGYALPGGADRVDEARRKRWAAVIAALDAAPFAPPDLAEVARRAGLDHREVTSLVQSGAVVRCGPVAFTRGAVDAAIDRLEALAAEVGPFTASQARQAWQTTRKYAIPLLEHLDTIGVTRFDGSHRTLTGRRPQPPRDAG